MKRHTRFAIVTAFLTLGVIFLGPELLLRMYHGKLLDVESLHRGNLTRTPRAEYDPNLGWVPAKGHHFRPPQERSHLNELGLRSNGLPIQRIRETRFSPSEILSLLETGFRITRRGQPNWNG